MHRKAINSFILLGFLGVGLPAWSQSPPKVVVDPQRTYADFAHAHKGCPENSECDPVMGTLLEQWKKLSERWNSEIPRALKEKEMQDQLLKRGWPVEFYTKTAAKTGFNPIIFSSACTHHNPKDAPLNRIWRGQSFVRGLENGQVVVSRGDTEFRVKPSDLLYLQPVYVHQDKAPPQKYLLPLEDRPLYLEKGKLQVLVEADDTYAILGIAQDGLWEVHLPPEDGLSAYFEDREDIACPKEAAPVESPFYQRSHCQKLLNKDTGKPVIVQFFWAC